MTKKINTTKVRRETLIKYLEKNYEKLTKKQLYDIMMKYIKAVYLRNGNLHVFITNEILQELDKENAYE